VPDHRIGFYAKREGIDYEVWKDAQRVKYIVKISEAEGNGLIIPKNIKVQEMYSVRLNKSKHKHKLVIYKII
jgi:hypothetical protein